MFVDCSLLTTEPCVTVELTNCDCETIVVDDILRGFFSPRLNKLGDFRIRFLEGTIPNSHSECCSLITVIIDWAEVGIRNFVAFSGRFTSLTNFAQGENADIIEWRGRSLNDLPEAAVIAYRSGQSGSFKDNIPAIQAAYEYLLENLQTPLLNRGDGSPCALQIFETVTVNPPTADQLASSPLWTGNRNYKNLLTTVGDMGDINGFYVQVEVDQADCSYTISLIDLATEGDLLLSECLENVYIQRINLPCSGVSRVHALGNGDGAAQLVATACLDDADCCGRETVILDNKEENINALQTLAEEGLFRLNPRERVFFDALWGCSLIPFRDIWLNDVVQLEFEDSIRPFRLDEFAFEIAGTGEGIQLVNTKPVFEEVVT